MVSETGRKRPVSDLMKPQQKRQKAALNDSEDAGKGTKENEDVTSSDSYESTDQGTSQSDDDSNVSDQGSAGEGEPDSPMSGDGFVTTDFNFEEPRESFFQGLRSLLSGYLDGTEYDTSALADFVIGQTNVGTIVTGDDENYCYAVLSVISLDRPQALPVLEQIHDFLTRHCPTDTIREKLKKAWKAKHTGFIVSERVINCPAELAPPLFQILQEEVQTAHELGATQAEKDEFAFEQYLLLSRAYRDADVSSEGGNAAIGYVRPEDEYLHKECSWSYTFPVEGRVVREGEPRRLRLVMLLTPQQYDKARLQMDAALGNDLPPL